MKLPKVEPHQVYFSLAFIFLLITILNIGDRLEKQVTPKKMRVNGREAAKVEYFKNGDILYPDYAISDTLIVTNAEQLNEAMGLVEQGFVDATDYQLDSIMHSHAVIYHKNHGLQPVNFETAH